MCLPINEWTTEDLESYLADVKEVHTPGSIWSDYTDTINEIEGLLKERAEAGTYATL